MGIPIESKIYVFGHDSVIGATLCRKLGDLGYHNIITRTADELDIRSQVDVYHFFEEELPDYVFLAKLTSESLADQLVRPAESLYDRLMGFLNIMHASYLYEVRKLLNIIDLHASWQVEGYDSHNARRYHEETQEADQLMKAAITGLCDRYRKQYGCDFVSAVFDAGVLVDSAAPGAFAPASSVAPVVGAQVGSGHVRTDSQHRDSLYTENPADACLFIMEHVSATGAITVNTDLHPDQPW